MTEAEEPRNRRRAADSRGGGLVSGVALVVALAALGLTAWMAFFPETFGRSADPAYTDAERAEAKSATCTAFNTVRAGIVQNTNLQPPGGPEDVVGTMAVAANARISLLEGGQYLRARTAAATPTELADAVETFTETLMDIGAAATAGVPNTDPVQSTRLKDADAMSTGILGLCA